MTDLKELEVLVKFARKHGLQSVEANGVKLTLGQPKTKRTRTAPGQPKEIEQQLPEYSEDQVLNWSAE